MYVDAGSFSEIIGLRMDRNAAEHLPPLAFVEDIRPQLPLQLRQPQRPQLYQRTHPHVLTSLLVRTSGSKSIHLSSHEFCPSSGAIDHTDALRASKTSLIFDVVQHFQLVTPPCETPLVGLHTNGAGGGEACARKTKGVVGDLQILATVCERSIT